MMFVWGIQGIDALGVVTLVSVTSSFPFSSALSSSALMADEDVNSLRTLRRLLLLLSGLQKSNNVSIKTASSFFSSLSS